MCFVLRRVFQSVKGSENNSLAPELTEAKELTAAAPFAFFELCTRIRLLGQRVRFLQWSIPFGWFIGEQACYRIDDSFLPFRVLVPLAAGLVLLAAYIVYTLRSSQPQLLDSCFVAWQ